MCVVYNCLVTFQRPNRAAEAESDGAIDLSDSANWTNICTRRGKLLPVSGREVFTEQQTEAIRSHTLAVLSDPLTRQLSPTDRLQYRDRENVLRTLQIVSVLAALDGKVVSLSCLEDSR